MKFVLFLMHSYPICGTGECNKDVLYEMMSSEEFCQSQQDGGSGPSTPSTANSFPPTPVPPPSPISEDSEKSVQVEQFIGSLSPPSLARSASLKLKLPLEMVTGSQLGPLQLENTFGKKTLPLRAPDLSSGWSPFDGMSPQIGMPSDSSPLQENCPKYQRTYSFVIIGRSLQSLQTMQFQLRAYEKFMYFGAIPALEKVSEPGKRVVYRLTLRILDPSGGAVTAIKLRLSWMNFEEELISHTFFDGLTDTQLLWSEKADPALCWPPKYGLLATWILGHGIPI